MATGVAKPSAQGQLITSTEIALAIANPNVLPTKSHTIKVTNAKGEVVGAYIQSDSKRIELTYISDYTMPEIPYRG